MQWLWPIRQNNLNFSYVEEHVEATATITINTQLYAQEKSAALSIPE